MHLYVLARGQQDFLERWKNDVSAMFLKFKYKKDEPPGMVRIGVRPIELLEIVYPEEHHKEVMQLIQPYASRPEVDGFKKLLARVFRLKPIKPAAWTPGPKIYNQYVSIVGVGYRKDKRDKDGIELL